MSIRHIALTALCAILATSFVAAQEHGKPAEKPAGKEAKEAPKPAAVFVITNMHGKHEVMTKEALDAKNKEAEAEFKKATEAFEKEKKAAEAAHKKFEGQAPKHHTIETVGGEFPTKDAAEAALKKMMDEEAKKKGGDKPAEGGKKEKEAPHKN